MQHPPQKSGIDWGKKIGFLQTSTFTHDSVRIESKSQKVYLRFLSPHLKNLNAGDETLTSLP